MQKKWSEREERKSEMATLQSEGMLSREQLLFLFNRFSQLTSQPDVKKRIADALEDKQEAVAVTTAIQEAIFLEMAVDPRFGISCLAKVNMVFENDRDLMIRFYKFVAKPLLALVSSICLATLLFFYPFGLSLVVHVMQNASEEMVIDEAQLGQEGFAEKMHNQQKLQEQQLEMLKHMRKFHLDDQSAILEKLHQQLENTNFEGEESVLSSEQIQEIVRRRVSPLFMPK